MKTTTFLIFAAGVALLGNSAFGASAVEYSYNNAPGASNDSKVNGGPATAQAWTIVTTTASPSNFGPYYGNVNGTTFWDIYDAPGRYGSQSGEITQTNTFVGGALTLNQSVSLEYSLSGDGGVASGGEVGLNLLNGSTTEFSIYETSGASDFVYTDATKTGATTNQAYQTSTVMNFSFKITGTDTYQVDFNNNIWSGTISAPITGIQVFNENGGWEHRSAY
jgi:hypothetical protein